MPNSAQIVRPSNDTPAPPDYRSVRLPHFITSDPQLWLCMVEATFTAAGINNNCTKFGFVINALEPNNALELRDVLVCPPSDENYEKLKTEIVKRFSKSQEAKIRQILEREQLGDRKPSQFLRHLRGLAGTSVPDSWIRTLWLDRLSTSIKAILSTQDDLDLIKLGELADKIADVTDQTPSRLSICETQPKNSEIDKLRSEIAELRNAIRDLNRPSRPTLRSHSNTRNRSKSREFRNNGLCWYHNKFSARAHKCIPPCQYNNDNVNNAAGCSAPAADTTARPQSKN